MKVLYISMVIHEEEQIGFIFKGVNKRTTGFAFEKKEEALEHQEQVNSLWNDGRGCGVMVCVDDPPYLSYLID